ncbi:MAG: DUF3142 domain-containing protein, partial [Planctomycetes bacterium]|nr:DUF3142 domain-containing protein [Planctomycetota bacterium]
MLAAEVTWNGTLMRVTRVSPDYELIRRGAVEVGIALRIGSFGGAFSESDKTALSLAALAGELVRAAEAKGLIVRELQVDFDCATARLDGYRLWVLAIRHATGSVPVTITALPTWLNGAAFRALAETAGRYILQVHSLA